MAALRHTANIAIGINAVVIDDQGRAVSGYILPVALLYIRFPAWLYAWLGSLRFETPPAQSVARYVAGWRADLAFMVLAIKLLVTKNKARRHNAGPGGATVVPRLPLI